MSQAAAGDPAPFEGRDHDHGRCVAGAVHAASHLCLQRGLRLTALRRRVLELVWRNHRPVGAYEILEELRREGRRAAPPTVYRALEFLMAQGFVHRIVTRNAFVGCAHPNASHVGQFLICEGCGDAHELKDERITSAVHESARSLGFHVQGQTVEVKGLCPECRNGGGGRHDRG